MQGLLHRFFGPGRLGAFVEVHDCHARARCWGGLPPSFPLWLIPGCFGTLTRIQDAFVHSHHRLTVPILPTKLSVGAWEVPWLPVQSEEPLRALWMSPYGGPSSAPLVSSLTCEQAGRGLTEGDLSLLLSLSLPGGAEDVFPSPRLTGFLIGPQSHRWLSR